MISTNTKKAITRVVANYRKLYPDEYVAVVEQIRLERMNLKDDFASTKSDSALEQKIYELPETLYIMLKNKLTDLQWKELYDKDKSGVRWFANTFKEFAIAQKI